jgi:hypothetical protein
MLPRTPIEDPSVESNEFSFQAGSQGGASLAIELIGPGTRIRGTVRLGSYVRLSDLLNFHDQVLQVADATVLDPTGKEITEAVPALDVRLAQISLVVDYSGYVPPIPTEELGIPKVSHRLMAVTEAQLITGTFFIHPSAEPSPYLLAFEPRWIPITRLRVRSLIVPSVQFDADFGVLNRAAVTATTVRDEPGQAGAAADGAIAGQTDEAPQGDEASES